jgi:ribosome-associated protein
MWRTASYPLRETTADMSQPPHRPAPAEHHTTRRRTAVPEDRPARLPQHEPQRDASNRDFAIKAAQLATDLHCENALVFDVRGLSDMTDYILIASGTSDRQIKSVADDIEDLAERCGLGRLGRELDGPAKWLVLDFVDAVVHLFDPQTRAHYDLEMLWGDAQRVAWQRNGDHHER